MDWDSIKMFVRGGLKYLVANRSTLTPSKYKNTNTKTI